MTSSISVNRLKAEYKEINSNPILNLTIDENNNKICYISFKGAEKTLYENENFKLKFELSDYYVRKYSYNYYYIIIIQPLKKPSVTFVENIPVNPFVFSNGLICLDILDTNWSPVLTMSSITMSIISMLSGTKVKKKPVNDDLVIKSGIKNFNQGKWRHKYINV